MNYSPRNWEDNYLMHRNIKKTFWEVGKTNREQVSTFVVLKIFYSLCIYFHNKAIQKKTSKPWNQQKTLTYRNKLIQVKTIKIK